MKHIHLGHIYQDKWGNERIPVRLLEDDAVVYLERLIDFRTVVTFNPYKNRVSNVEFLKKFSEKENSINLDPVIVLKLSDLTLEFESKWNNLINSAAVDIFNIIK